MIDSQTKPVLVLGGRERHDLAIVRSLGARQIPVYTADSYRNCTSALSKYCKGEYVYPNPENNPAGFLEALKDILRSREFEMVFAVTDIIPILLSQHKNELSKLTKILVPDWPIFELANSKEKTFQIAETNKIPAPKTFLIKNDSDLNNSLEKIKFPAVLKPVSKTNLASGKSVVQKAIYVKTGEELKVKYQEISHNISHPIPFLLQEYIPGDGGYGVGIFADKGNTLASFAFQRLHEYPVSGGASTLRTGIDHPVMVAIAKQLVKAMSWDGVAMVEFKIDSRDHLPKLIEVNGRFWGSLALAIYSGVDFPYILYKHSRGEGLPLIQSKTGIKARWLIPGDIMYFLEAILLKKNRLHTIQDFFQYKGVIDDVLSISDPLPILGELKICLLYLWEILSGKRNFHGELKS